LWLVICIHFLQYFIIIFYRININYSKISQELFWNIFRLTQRKEHIYFAELNKEFQKTNNDTGEGYYFDFVDTVSKKIIEFNGDKFHANPLMYECTDKPNPYQPDMTSETIWDHDNKKIKFIKDEGYDVMVVWQSEYIKNKQEIINKCLKFIDNYIIE